MNTKLKKCFIIVNVMAATGLAVRSLTTLKRSAASAESASPEPAGPAPQRAIPRPNHPAPARWRPAIAPPPEMSVVETDDEKAVRAQREYEALLGRSFDAQPVDPLWAGEAERAVRSKLGALLPEGASINSVACRKTLCRLEIAQVRESGHADFIASASTKLAWDGPGLITKGSSDGHVVSLAYLGRTGVAFPAPPTE
jgi:hypothetical protein